ncbi:MAG: hypothetical protein HPZ91_15430 [Lentisphaeria bacterium]|nr:hypothetical protein [Lentisphaeria bacterium]
MIATTEQLEKPKFAPRAVEGLEPRPAFWQVRPAEITAVCEAVRRGRDEVIAATPGGFPVHAVFYGDFSEPPPQTNWSAGSSSTTDSSYFRRAGLPPTVVWCAGIHGAEAESVAFAVNLIELLEHGADLLGRRHERLCGLLRHYRLIVVPCVNMDGRSISPDHLRNVPYEEFRRVSQGIWLDGSLIGWRGSKEYFPLPLDRVAYPGGYPNSDGFNIMHDACPGHIRTAEAAALLRLVERYSADFVLNAHSCEGEPFLLAPSEFNYRTHVERGIRAASAVNRALFDAGLRSDPAPGLEPGRQVNLNNLFSLASGALALTLECTVSHGLSFEQLLDVNFVTFETLLESGLADPFVNREMLRR